MRVTILGCGSSGGSPLVGCGCSVCKSTNPKNRRLRASIWVEIDNVSFLIDASPDLRQQALCAGIKKVDALLFTHSHADHVHGIDEMRSFNYIKDDSIPAYGDAVTMVELKERFPYIFQPKPEKVWFRPSLEPHIFPDLPVQEVNIQGIPITLIEQRHGKIRTIGYRFGNLAYCTDVDVFPDASLEALSGLDVWIIDCLRYRESYSHSTLETTLRWIEAVKPKQAILTHMAHDFDYDRLLEELPPGVVPAYDGMVIEL